MIHSQFSWPSAVFLLVVAAMILPCVDPALADKPTFYDPVEKKITGWTIAVDPQLLLPEHEAVATKAFEALANHLQRVT